MAYKFYVPSGNPITTRIGDLYTPDTHNMITVASPTYLDIADLVNAGAVPLGQIGLDNISATTDPGVSNDNTQDYAVGSLWVNTTNGRVWICQSSATGAAAWALAVVPGTGAEPSNNLEQFGSGTATMLSEGNVYHYASAGLNPAATGADIVLAVYSIPANSFDGVSGTNRGLSFNAFGSFANNANTKRAKIIFNPTAAVVGSAVSGGTLLADTGAYSTTGAVGWNISAQVFKYGAAGSNTQYGQETGIIIGSTHGGMGVPVALTAVESAAILVAVTGNATTAATDIALNSFQVNAMN